MMFGDILQLPPIPSSSALFLPPDAANCGLCAREMLDVFWGDNVDTINLSCLLDATDAHSRSLVQRFSRSVPTRIFGGRNV